MEPHSKQDVAPRTLRHLQPNTGNDDAEGNLKAGDDIPPTPRSVEPAATEDKHDFWSLAWDFFYCHHDSFPIPLKSIDVNRETKTNLDNLEESSFDDYWNADGNKTLSKARVGFARLQIVM